MKNYIYILFLFFVGFAYGQHEGHQTTKAAGNSTIYACPMHPEVTSSKPGKCPKCGMALVKKKAAGPSKPKAKPANKPKTATTKKPAQQDGKPEVQEETDARKVEGAPTEKIAQEKIKPAYKGKLVKYDLFVKDTVVNYTGKLRKAIAINGSIPAPTLTFTEGDTAEVHVHNMMDKETSIHWHGVFLPNRYDGVPYLTQMPIKPHSTYVYKFPVIQNGTYWYHSHTKLQEQSGMYGALIFNKQSEPSMPAIPVVLSDWIDMKPREVDRRLHNASDWFGIKKNAIQSYAEAAKAGRIGTKIANEWKRMEAMDVSDVAYDVFLVNGKNLKEYPQFKAGDKVKLRIINGGASSYFWLSYAGGKITVVGNDGNDVEPVEVDRLIVGTAETYDVIVTVPENMSYEFLVTPEDRTKFASLWLGDGMKMSAAKLPKLKYFDGMQMMNEMMDMQGNMKPMGMEMSNQTMDMNVVMYPEVTGESEPQNPEKSPSGHEGHNMPETEGEITTLNYGMLRALEKTTLPKAPVKNIHFELTGNMNRYVWTIDNKTVSESDRIMIKKGENVRITMYNNSMMRHPMHLHGHDFRLFNGQGDHAPMKNTVDIMPMETDTLEFAATESGDWFFHCHILYHMMSGMGRIFRYENSEPNPEIKDPKYAQRKLFQDDRHFHFMAENDFATNGSDGMAMLANTRWQLASEWRLGYNGMHGYEIETHFGRYLGKNQWFMPFIGFDWRYRRMEGEMEENIFGQKNSKDERSAFSAGFEYTLPMLFKFAAELYTDGTVRVSLRREDIPVSRRLRMALMINSDKEYMGGFKYIIGRYIAPSIHYDSDMGLGVGLSLTY